MTAYSDSLAVEVSAAFSSAVFRDLASALPNPSTRAKIGRVAALGGLEGLSVAHCFDRAWELIVREYRNEYVFKNQLVSKIVFGRHSPTTASALPEMRMGASRADLVIVNGTSTTYEVKTDLDQFARLVTQLPDYETRSEFVNVVVSDSRAVAAEREVPKHVGVIMIRRGGALSTARPAESNIDRMSSAAMFRMLRTKEAIEILSTATGYQLDVPSGHAWKRARDLFESLPVDTAHAGVVRSLHRRGRMAAELASEDSFPRSLRTLAYVAELSAVGRRRVRERLAAPAALFLGA